VATLLKAPSTGLQRERIDISALAETLVISRRSLERLFRKHLGISVRHAITFVRLEVARHFQAKTNQAITAVTVMRFKNLCDRISGAIAG